MIFLHREKHPSVTQTVLSTNPTSCQGSRCVFTTSTALQLKWKIEKLDELENEFERFFYRLFRPYFPMASGTFHDISCGRCVFCPPGSNIPPLPCLCWVPTSTHARVQGVSALLARNCSFSGCRQNKEPQISWSGSADMVLSVSWNLDETRNLQFQRSQMSDVVEFCKSL